MLDSTGTDIASILDSTGKENVSMTNDLKSDETGISPTQSEVMMASFRVDRELWAKFGAIAKRERLTATDVLTDYIQRCTDNDKTEYAVSISNDVSASMDNYDTDKLADAVRTVISTLSLLSKDDVLTIVSEHIDSDDAEQRIKAQVEPLADLITELEAYTRSQIETLRNDLKKPLAIAR